MILIKNGSLVLENKTIQDDLLILEGKIKAIGRNKINLILAKENQNYQEIDGTGKYVLPSFIDMHFHLRNPGLAYKQTYEEANKACLKGGFTHVVAMANTLPVADCPEIISEVKENTKELPLYVHQVSAVTKGLKGQELVNFGEMLELTRIFSDDGRNVDNEKVMREALIKSKELGFMILDHDEPETEMVLRNLNLVRETGGRLHFCHISKKASLEAIIEGKAEGLGITVEVAPHHIFSSNLDYKVNPPIGTEADVDFLLKSIEAGQVDIIATDHAPHSEEDKINGAPGIANIETAYSMVRKAFYDKGISMETLAKLMAIEPAKLLGVEHGIKEGLEGNLVIVSDEDEKIDINNISTRAKNNPYHNWDIKGKVEMTLVKGEIVYDNARA